MFLSHLSLHHFRNYLSLELALAPGPIVLSGENAQGKTNVLEAVYLLSTGRSPRALSEREVMTRCLPAGELPVTRLVAEAQRATGHLKLELALVAAGWQEAFRGNRTAAPAARAGAGENGGGALHKQVRVNGTPRRLLDLIGQFPVVLFSPEDLDLVTGAPALRRRYLDITVAQIEPSYTRTLQRYQRVVMQRNHLLRRVQDGQAQERELAFWDAALLDTGATIAGHRLRALAELGPLAATRQDSLAAGRDALQLQYVASGLDLPAGATPETPDLRTLLAAALESARRREIAQGQTVVGPHRDDLRLMVNGTPVATFGSRGQQRTVALGLKLAEAEFLRRRGNDDPILLLDDAFSEMDRGRRAALTDAARSFEQVLITTAEPDQLPADFLAEATHFRVVAGHIGPL